MKKMIFCSWICVAAFLTAAAPVWADDLEALAAQAANYMSGASEAPLRQIEQRARASIGDPVRHAEVESVLIRMLAPEATFETKRFACYTLAVYGSESSLPALEALFKKEETVGIACFALGGMPFPKAGECLRSALSQVRGLSRVQVIVTLGQRAEAASVKPLAGLLKDPDAAVVRAAIRALGAVDTAEAREAVLALRNAADPALAADVAAAALSLADKRLAAGDAVTAAAIGAGFVSAGFPSQVRRGAFSLMLKADVDGGVERVRQTLEAAAPDAVLSPVAIAYIAGLRGEGLSKEFGRLLPRLPPTEQVLLVEALACRADAEARASIRRQVCAADPAVRCAAIDAVGRLEDASAIGLLVQALKGAVTPDESKVALAALANLRGGETTDQAMVEAFRQASGEAQAVLVEVLSRRGGRVTVPVLLALAVGSDTPLARAAGQALARQADSGDAASLTALQKAVAEGEAPVREVALRTLAAWRGLDAWETLAGVYAKPENEAQRTLALRGMVKMAGAGNAQPDSALIGRYGALLAGARSEADRKMIVNTLAGVAHPDALALALPLMEQPGIRSEAAQAVERIARAIQKTHPALAREALQKIKVP